MSTTTTHHDERGNILEMVAAGKINAADAVELLSALGSTLAEAPHSPEPVAPPPAIKKKGNGPTPKWLCVRVSDLDSGKSKVSVNLPIAFLKLGLRLGHRFAPKTEGIEWEQVNEVLSMTEGGILVDVADESSGDHVQIFVD